MDKDLIASRIKEHLLLKGITAAALGDKIGVTRQYITNVLNDHGKSISLNIIIKIANVLDMEVGTLLLPPPIPVNKQSDENFSATVRCQEGIFKAITPRELRDITNSVTSIADPVTLAKRTLERMLRFPAGKDAAIISELMSNLFRSMYADEWSSYFKNKLADLLPAGFQMDYAHLATFMEKEEIEEFEKSMCL